MVTMSNADLALLFSGFYTIVRKASYETLL